ncbi:MAG: hypothetical protein ACTTHU_08155 [Treponema sp.]
MKRKILFDVLLILFLSLFSCRHNSDMYTGNLYIEKGKISCNGYNAAVENITNAFDQNPETYAIFTLYDDKVSFINLLVDVTQGANTNNVSKIHIKSEDSRNEKTKIIATIPDSNNIDKTVSTIYNGNTFDLDKNINASCTCKKNPFLLYYCEFKKARYKSIFYRFL